MSKPPRPKPCFLRVVSELHGRRIRYVEDVYYEGNKRVTGRHRYPSIRAARRAAASHASAVIDPNSRAAWSIEIETVNGEVKELCDSVADSAYEMARQDQWENSIGARLSRGEAVAI